MSFKEFHFHLCKLFILFMLYSFAGWALESLFILIDRGVFVNTGFLHLPFCPLYGLGGLLIGWLLEPFKKNPFVFFVVSVLALSALEYAASFLMEVIFHVRVWDYSMHSYNLNGRIWLVSSLLFGLMSMLAVYVLKPLFDGWLAGMLAPCVYVLSACLAILFIGDLAITSVQVLKLDFFKDNWFPSIKFGEAAGRLIGGRLLG